jgi:hypothetical protein
MKSRAVALWANEQSLTKCVEDTVFDAKITKQSQRGTTLFWVTGTPGNVLINRKTWEYSVISWAYPTSEFIKVIELLK